VEEDAKDCKSDKYVEREVVLGPSESRRLRYGAVKFSGVQTLVSWNKKYLCAHRDPRTAPWTGLVLDELKPTCKEMKHCKSAVQSCTAVASNDTAAWKYVDVRLPSKRRVLCARQPDKMDDMSVSISQSSLADLSSSSGETAAGDATFNESLDVSWNIETHGWTPKVSLWINQYVSIRTLWNYKEVEVRNNDNFVTTKLLSFQQKTAEMWVSPEVYAQIGAFYGGFRYGVDITRNLVQPINERLMENHQKRVELCKSIVKQCQAFCDLDGYTSGYDPILHDHCPGQFQAPPDRGLCEAHAALDEDLSPVYGKWLETEQDCENVLRPVQLGVRKLNRPIVRQDLLGDYVKLNSSGGVELGRDAKAMGQVHVEVIKKKSRAQKFGAGRIAFWMPVIVFLFSPQMLS
jgi:hypothetical protein